MKPSTFDVARRIGMGGPVPWYGWVYGGLILGVLVLVACGLIILIISMYRRAFRRSRQDFHPLPENKSEYVFGPILMYVSRLTVHPGTSALTLFD
jgi:uncharacterized membrane protein